MAIEGLHWKTAKPQDYEYIETFLKKHEPYLVAAASRFIQYKNRTLGKGKIIPGRDQMLIGRDGGQQIQAFLFRSGQILHPFFLDFDAEGAKKLTRRFIKLSFSKRIYSLQGLERDVKIAEQALEQEGYHIQDQFDYYLMHLNEPVWLPPKPEGLTLIDNPTAEQVYPLQAAYEQEEVIPAHSTFHEAHCRQGLERILAEELLVFAEYGGVSAAKANTNARSYSCRQIGGVYVQPQFRGKGIGTYVVAKLVEQVQKEGVAVGLFVKKQNLPAIRVYEKLGFTPIGSYRINYY